MALSDLDEVQALNAALRGINDELSARVEALGRANADLKSLLESTQLATIFLDPQLRIRNFTPAVSDIFQVEVGDLGRPIGEIPSSLIYPTLEADSRQVLQTLQPIEHELESSRSSTHYLVRVLPYRSAGSCVGGVVLNFFDITAAAMTERALHESENRFRMMARAVPTVIFTANRNLDWDYVNPRFYELTGLAEGAALGTGWHRSLPEDELAETLRRCHEAANADRGFEMEHRICAANGEWRWVMTRAEPMFDAQGRIERWFGSSTDVHERRLAEDRQKLLMAELQHRVKNILAVVRSIFSRTFDSAHGNDAAADHYRGRLDALARTQNVLVRTPEGAIDLEEMVREELLAHGVGENDQIAVWGPRVRLRFKAAEALGLAIHELATNAAKYGALSAPDGALDVRWSVENGQLRWRWAETGVKIKEMPERRGFGRELIEQGLPYELRAATALSFTPDGVCCTIDVPLSDRVVFPDREEPDGG